ncbi:transposase [Streptomyces anulatus]|nr:transposase [Streptomyces anulatus]
MDRGRGAAPAARGPPRRIPRRKRPRLLPGGGRRLPHPGAEGGARTGRSPVDRGRPGSKHHLITDADGIPLAVTLTGGNRNDVTQLIPLLQACRRCGASAAGHGAVRRWCWATTATTTTSTAVWSGTSVLRR